MRRTIYVALQQKIGHSPIAVMTNRRPRRRVHAGQRDCFPAAAFEEEMSMVDPIYQVPNEVRDFAEKSVEQARKAFEGFAGAAQKALTSTQELPIVPPGAKDVGVKAFSFAEANVNAAFDLAQKLVKAKDPQEVFQLQAEFVKSQFEAIQEQTKELGAAFQRSTTLKS
jgi:phasin